MNMPFFSQDQNENMKIWKYDKCPISLCKKKLDNHSCVRPSLCSCTESRLCLMSILSQDPSSIQDKQRNWRGLKHKLLRKCRYFNQRTVLYGFGHQLCLVTNNLHMQSSSKTTTENVTPTSPGNGGQSFHYSSESSKSNLLLLEQVLSAGHRE